MLSVNIITVQDICLPGRMSKENTFAEDDTFVRATVFSTRRTIMWMLLAGLLSLTTFDVSAQTCSGPGKERWPVKITLVAGADLNNPKSVSLNVLLGLKNPPNIKHDDPRFQDVRIPEFSNSVGVQEGDIIRTVGWLYLIATESDDCDYHIQISNQPRTTTNKPTAQDGCVIVEAPKPEFVDSTDLKQDLSTERTFIKTKILKGNEPSNGGSVMIHPVCVEVTGQLFYDDAHLGKGDATELRGKKGMNSNTLWELHPIISFRIVQTAACHF
jgi:hypothetical protein